MLLRGKVIASSRPAGELDALPEMVTQHVSEITELKRTPALPLTVGQDKLLAVAAPFPGQAGEQQAYYALLGMQPAKNDLGALLSNVSSNDLKWGNFPWVPVALVTFAMIAVGLILQRVEVEAPLGRLRRELQKLAAGDIQKIDDHKYRAKYGGLARDVNAAVERFTHAPGARSEMAGKDLNAILGPSGGSTFDLPSTGSASRDEVVADALRGYLSDDVWGVGGRLERVAGAPVLSKGKDRIVGAIYVGAETGPGLVERLKKNLDVDVALLLRGKVIASSRPAGELDALPEMVTQHVSEIAELKRTPALPLTVGQDKLLAVAAPFPGQAGEQQAYYALLGMQPAKTDLGALLSNVSSNDLKWGNFPWVPVALVTFAMIAVGLILQRVEVEAPLGRLRRELQKLAAGDLQKIDDHKYRAKYGGLARDVNAAVERFTHAPGARSEMAGKDLNAILGPSGGSTFDLPSTGSAFSGSTPAPAFAPPVAPAFPPPPPAFNAPTSPAFPPPPPGGFAPPPLPSFSAPPAPSFSAPSLPQPFSAAGLGGSSSRSLPLRSSRRPGRSSCRPTRSTTARPRPRPTPTARCPRAKRRASSPTICRKRKTRTSATSSTTSSRPSAPAASRPPASPRRSFSRSCATTSLPWSPSTPAAPSASPSTSRTAKRRCARRRFGNRRRRLGSLRFARFASLRSLPFAPLRFASLHGATPDSRHVRRATPVTCGANVAPRSISAGRTWAFCGA